MSPRGHTCVCLCPVVPLPARGPMWVHVSERVPRHLCVGVCVCACPWCGGAFPGRPVSAYCCVISSTSICVSVSRVCLCQVCVSVWWSCCSLAPFCSRSSRASSVLGPLVPSPGSPRDGPTWRWRCFSRSVLAQAPLPQPQQDGVPRVQAGPQLPSSFLRNRTLPGPHPLPILADAPPSCRAPDFQQCPPGATPTT